MGSKSGLRRITNYSGHPFETIMIITTVVISTIVAFAWRDYAESLFDKYLSGDNDVLARFKYAFIGTIVLVIVIYLLGKIADRRSSNLDNVELKTSAPISFLSPRHRS